MLGSKRTISATGRGPRGRARVHAEPGWCPVVERQAICARILETGACAPRTFSDYVQDYGKWASINTRGWVQTERYSAERPAAALGDQPLESITSAFVEGAFERLLAGRSGATRNRYCDWLSGMFKRAVRLGLVAMNPVTGIPKLREAGGRTVFLKPDEETAGRQALPARLRSAFTVAVNTGLRFCCLVMAGGRPSDRGRVRGGGGRWRWSNGTRTSPLVT